MRRTAADAGAPQPPADPPTATAWAGKQAVGRQLSEEVGEGQRQTEKIRME